jgi:hypothetical protein
MGQIGLIGLIGLIGPIRPIGQKPTVFHRRST